MLIPAVVIPTRNEERNISNVLDDLENQTTRCKVIVVDGNSEDDTVEIAKSYGTLVVIGESTVGMARHWGTEYADSEFVLQTDADARIPPDWVERHSALLQDHVIATGPIQYPKGEIQVLFNPLFLLLQNFLMTANITCVGANMSYRKPYYLGFENRGYGEDAMFLKKMVGEWGAQYHVHDNGIVVVNHHDPFEWWVRELGLAIKKT